jgi:uncharacterized protein (TIGR03437 family)
LQVTASSANLRLTVSGGDQQAATPGVALGQPVAFRVTDINDLPYPGVAVAATITGGGSLAAASAVTDDAGIARFQWTPGAGAANTLTARVEGGPSASVTAISRPVIASNSVVNAASFQTTLAPGAIATIFGANLAGADVTINGRPVQIYFAGDRQVNFVLPLDTALGAAEVKVTTAAGSATAQVTVLDTAPGIFFDAASGLGAVIDRGQGVFEVYVTGLGAVRGGALNETVVQPQVLIGAEPAEVLFSGLAPGFPGLYQLNVRASATTPAGPQTLAVIVNGRRSNDVRINVTR